MNIKLTLSYDGTEFFGWQETKDGPSIESALKQVLEQIYQEPIALQAASRTDRGVHAEGQVVNYCTKKKKDFERLKISLNQMLPQTVRISTIQQEQEHFHPTLDALGKEYHYFISTGPVQSPFNRHFSWHYPAPFNLDNMRLAANCLIGTHDFAAFCNANKPPPRNTVRKLSRLDITQEGDTLKFEVEGDHFLYKMVRNLVGTLVYIGVGKLAFKHTRKLIANKDRTLAGITAPAHGLHLKKVLYTKYGN